MSDVARDSPIQWGDPADRLGLRVGEMLALRRSDVDFAKCFAAETLEEIEIWSP